ncbi:hypothetical protein GJ744_010238 [Endocarpon pusillum]|uniref:Uncharacterized protein n=1 Tax=Endocarpon pusillum TaxID=364733 RepID=A0A8H7E3W0_9EURO|nr:hypothetical protein GJ744_010238 [Endocarpon pusillum]
MASIAWESIISPRRCCIRIRAEKEERKEGSAPVIVVVASRRVVCERCAALRLAGRRHRRGRKGSKNSEQGE